MTYPNIIDARVSVQFIAPFGCREMGSDDRPVDDYTELLISVGAEKLNDTNIYTRISVGDWNVLKRCVDAAIAAIPEARAEDKARRERLSTLVSR